MIGNIVGCSTYVVVFGCWLINHVISQAETKIIVVFHSQKSSFCVKIIVMIMTNFPRFEQKSEIKCKMHCALAKWPTNRFQLVKQTAKQTIGAKSLLSKYK